MKAIIGEHPRTKPKLGEISQATQAYRCKFSIYRREVKEIPNIMKT